MASISKKIEDFANEKLNSVLEVIPSGDSAATETATPEAHNVCLMLSFLSDIFMLIFLKQLQFRWLGVLVFSEGWCFRKFISFSGRCSNSNVAVFCIVHQGQWLLICSYFSLVLWYLLTASKTCLSYQKHSLLRHVFAIYGSLPQAAKQVLTAYHSLPCR